MKIIYDGTIPELALPEIKKQVERFKWIIPGWVQEFRIEYDAHPGKDDSDSAICSYSSYRYRQVTLVFYPLFLNEDEEIREKMVIHDLLHSLNGPLIDWTHSIISTLVEDSSYQKILLDQLDEYQESFIQDIAERIHQQQSLIATLKSKK